MSFTNVRGPIVPAVVLLSRAGEMEIHRTTEDEIYDGWQHIVVTWGPEEFTNTYTNIYYSFEGVLNYIEKDGDTNYLSEAHKGITVQYYWIYDPKPPPPVLQKAIQLDTVMSGVAVFLFVALIVLLRRRGRQMDREYQDAWAR